jgi:chemotaxis protein methyltransferase CheR
MTLSESDIEYVRLFVRQSAAILLDDKEYLIEARLGTLARKEGLIDAEALMRRLTAGSQRDRLHRKVVDALTTNETLFFRDVHPFEALRKEVLPTLIERNTAARRLDIWSAACSAGQEPFSIAMLISEHFPQLEHWRLSIRATDLSDAMLERARAGLFSQLEVNRGLPARLLIRFFEQTGINWQLQAEIRRMVQFERFNLIEPWPPRSPFDLILLRNVMIYFDVEVKRTIFGKVADALKPRGYLFLGTAETPATLTDRFETVEIGRFVCYRRKD